MKFNTRFNLRKQDSNKPQKIYLVCRFNNDKFVYPTPFNVVPKYWNTKTGEIRNVISEPERDVINTYLKELRTAANSIYINSIASHTPITKQLLKSELNKYTGLTIEAKATFKAWLQNYIDNSFTRINPKTGRVISHRTIQEYNTTFKCLQDFEKENRERLDFDTINLQTLRDFRDYLTTVKGFAVNNIAKHIDNVRQFLRVANDDKIQIDIDTINPKKFTIAREQPQDIYLNESDLKTIENLDLLNRPTYDKVRDLFLIGCNTGLRISDFNNIKPHNIKNGFIEIFQHKTGEKVVIPINETVKAILAKYNGNTPPKISDQKLNEYLKIICKEAGLNEQIEKQQTKGGIKKPTIYEKWQLTTSHTARRSYATNTTKKGVPIQSIMRITGHKKENVFLKYVKLSAMEHAEIINKYLTNT